MIALFRLIFAYFFAGVSASALGFIALYLLFSIAISFEYASWIAGLTGFFSLLLGLCHEVRRNDNYDKMKTNYEALTHEREALRGKVRTLEKACETKDIQIEELRAQVKSVSEDLKYSSGMRTDIQETAVKTAEAVVGEKVQNILDKVQNVSSIVDENAKLSRIIVELRSSKENLELKEHTLTKTNEFLSKELKKKTTECEKKTHTIVEQRKKILYLNLAYLKLTPNAKVGDLSRLASAIRSQEEGTKKPMTKSQAHENNFRPSRPKKGPRSLRS